MFLSYYFDSFLLCLEQEDPKKYPYDITYALFFDNNGTTLAELSETYGSSERTLNTRKKVIADRFLEERLAVRSPALYQILSEPFVFIPSSMSFLEFIKSKLVELTFSSQLDERLLRSILGVTRTAGPLRRVHIYHRNVTREQLGTLSVITRLLRNDAYVFGSSTLGIHADFWADHGLLERHCFSETYYSLRYENIPTLQVTEWVYKFIWLHSMQGVPVSTNEIVSHIRGTYGYYIDNSTLPRILVAIPSVTSLRKNYWGIGLGEQDALTFKKLVQRFYEDGMSYSEFLLTLRKNIPLPSSILDCTKHTYRRYVRSLQEG